MEYVPDNYDEWVRQDEDIKELPFIDVENDYGLHDRELYFEEEEEDDE